MNYYWPDEDWIPRRVALPPIRNESNESEWRVGYDQSGDVAVSTVFLQVDHRFVGDGPPILWETLVFGGNFDGQGDRYTSREAAEAGHAEWVRKAIGGDQ